MPEFEPLVQVASVNEFGYREVAVVLPFPQRIGVTLELVRSADPRYLDIAESGETFLFTFKNGWAMYRIDGYASGVFRATLEKCSPIGADQ